MPKRGENIYKRKDGRWEGRYVKDRTTTGKVLYGSIYGKTYREVKQQLVIVKTMYRREQHKSILFKESYASWIKLWLGTKVKMQVKSTTYSNYNRLIDKHIIPQLGNYLLEELDEKLVQNFVHSLQECKLSAGSIRNIFNIVNKSLKEAQYQGYLSINPCERIQLPKNSKATVKALNLQQQKRLEKVSFNDTFCSPVILSLYSGMRIGEISGLKWSDIDFESNLIYVRRTISRISNEHSLVSKTKLIEGTPKTYHSVRQIPLANNLKSYLLEKKKLATADYVITSGNKIAEPRTINYRFKKMIKAAEIPDINFHILRHTFATRCLERGVDIASLSKILGHQSVKMTLDTYTDSLFETRRQAMKTIDALFMESL